jgi:hypothetical protein
MWQFSNNLKSRSGNLFAVLLVGLVMCVCVQPPSAAATVTSIFGKQTSGELAQLSEEGALLNDGTKIPLADIHSIQFADLPPRPNLDAVVLQTRRGGKMLARSVTIADDVTQVVTVGGTKLEVSLEHLRSIWMGGKPTTEFEEALAKPSAELDRIFVKVDKDIQEISGLIVGLDAKMLTLEFDGVSRSLPTQNLAGIVVAQIVEEKKISAQVSLKDGSVLPAESVALVDGALQLDSEVIGDIEISPGIVASIEFVSDRVTQLTSLTPTKSEHLPLVTLRRPAKKNQNVSGGPLVVTKQTFTRGFGVASASRLEFELDDNYETFVAQVGIDDETSGRGDCVFKVLADGRELWQSRARGGQAPQQIKLDIANVRELTLVVETGADLDLADHANWCQPRLIRPQP